MEEAGRLVEQRKRFRDELEISELRGYFKAAHHG